MAKRIEFFFWAFICRMGERPNSVDHREQIVLQSAQNAVAGGISIADYRFRHVADRLASSGYLKITEATPGKSNYAITAAGRRKLMMHCDSTPNDTPAISPVAIAAE